MIQSFSQMHEETLTPVHEINQCVLMLPVPASAVFKVWCGLMCRRQIFFFFSDWASKDEILESTLRVWVQEWADSAKGWCAATQRLETTPSPKNGTLKMKLPHLLSFLSIRLWTLMQTEAANGWRSLGFKKLLLWIKTTKGKSGKKWAISKRI